MTALASHCLTDHISCYRVVSSHRAELRGDTRYRFIAKKSPEPIMPTLRTVLAGVLLPGSDEKVGADEGGAVFGAGGEGLAPDRFWDDAVEGGDERVLEAGEEDASNKGWHAKP